MLRNQTHADVNKLSAPQRRVLQSPSVRWVGMDDKDRPVAEIRVGFMNAGRRWAITRAGDATNITER